MAGGFLLMAAILVGAIWGIANGNPMKGILIGTGLGIAIAILLSGWSTAGDDLTDL